MKLFKRACIVLLTAALVLGVFSGCTGTNGSGSAGSVTIWMPGDVPATPEDETESYRKQQALFEKIRTDTGIDLIVEQIPFASYDEKCNTALNTNTGPDILMVNSVTLGVFADKGYLKDTAETFKTSTIKQGDFFPGLWKHVELGGKVYGLPIDTGTRAIIYNKDLLAKAGFTFDKEVSWEQIVEAAIACTIDEDNDGNTDIYGYGFAGGEHWTNLYEGVGMFLIQNGAEVYNEKMDQAQFSSPKVIEAVKMMADLYDAGVMPKDSITITDGSVITDMLLSGKVAMLTGGHWTMDYILEKNPDFEVGIALGKKEQIGSSTGGWCMSVTNKATDMDSIKTVYEYIFQPENLVHFTSLMPATIEANKLALQDERYELYKEVLPLSRHPIAIDKNLPEVSRMLRDQMQRVFLGEATAEQAMAQLDQDVNALMAR